MSFARVLVQLLIRIAGVSPGQIAVRKIETGMLRQLLLNLATVSNLLAQAVVPLPSQPGASRQETAL